MLYEDETQYFYLMVHIYAYQKWQIWENMEGLWMKNFGEKRPSNAGVVVMNSKFVGLAPEASF
jgi:hypothetical protein